MTLPAREDTTAKYPYYVREVDVDHIPITAIAAHDQYDFVVYAPWCGLIDGDSGVGSVGIGDSTTLFVQEGILIRTDDLDPAATFNTFGQDIWWDATNGYFTDTEDDGLYLVGYLREATNADGVMGFEKRRYVIDGEGT